VKLKCERKDEVALSVPSCTRRSKI